MRAALVLATLLAALLVPMAASHPAERCAADTPFPSFAIFNLAPGRTIVLGIPPNQFGSLVALAPVDAIMYVHSTCEVDESCHHHALVGPMVCGAERAANVQLHNPGPTNAIVEAAIGLCVDPAVCRAL